MKKIIFLSAFILAGISVFTQTDRTPKKKNRPKVNKESSAQPQASPAKLPLNVFLQLIDSSEEFVINHATEFQHIDLPKRNFDTFNSYIIDSVAEEVPGIQSLIYYNYTLKDGRIIIGDIYWNDKTSYIVFKIYDKKYVNYFSRDGVQQLKSLFKL